MERTKKESLHNRSADGVSEGGKGVAHTYKKNAEIIERKKSNFENPNNER